MQVGVIGLGRLGKLIAKYLAQDFQVIAYDKIEQKEYAERIGARWGSFQEVAACECVIPFVPISEFESVCRSLVPYLKEGALVIDVCSVKEYPVQLMKEIFPEYIQILATHPMFGPDSAKDTLYGSKMVLCKTRMENLKYNQIKSYLHKYGITTIETTPEDHDKQISHSLLLTHFIGRALIAYQAKNLTIDTKGYRRLLKILETVENDSFQLFKDMNKYNRYSEDVRKNFMECLQKVNGQIYL